MSFLVLAALITVTVSTAIHLLSIKETMENNEQQLKIIKMQNKVQFFELHFLFRKIRTKAAFANCPYKFFILFVFLFQNFSFCNCSKRCNPSCFLIWQLCRYQLGRLLHLQQFCLCQELHQFRVLMQMLQQLPFNHVGNFSA